MPTILIIDDFDQTRSLFQEFFESQGFTVITAREGHEGLNMSKTFHPDVVITDIFMPDKEGLETIVELRKQSANVKIIAMSGCQHIRDLDILKTARKLGADITFLKPIDLHLLLKSVNTILASSLDSSESDAIKD